MEVAKILVSENHATAQVLKKITSGTIGATVSFEFDETWDGWNKMYVFRAGSKTKDDTKATGIIPAELLEPGLRLEVGVYGTKGEIAIPTIWADLGVIRAGANPSGDESTDPSLPVWAQIQADVDGLRNAILFDPQVLTDDQKAQARENIGVCAEEDVNEELEKKLDKETPYSTAYAPYSVYGRLDNGEAAQFYTTMKAEGLKIPRYTAGGNLRTNTPSLNTDAANKKYVDDKVKLSEQGIIDAVLAALPAAEGVSY